MKTNINSRLFEWHALLNELGTHRLGRVTLHLICMIRNPERRQWHWHGVVREFVR